MPTFFKTPTVFLAVFWRKPWYKTNTDLCGDDNFLALREVLQRSTEHFLRSTNRVDIGGIEKVDAEVCKNNNKEQTRIHIVRDIQNLVLFSKCLLFDAGKQAEQGVELNSKS